MQVQHATRLKPKQFSTEFKSHSTQRQVENFFSVIIAIVRQNLEFEFCYLGEEGLLLKRRQGSVDENHKYLAMGIVLISVRVVEDINS